MGGLENTAGDGHSVRTRTFKRRSLSQEPSKRRVAEDVGVFNRLRISASSDKSTI